jgi:putative sterol carrier protein
VADSASEFFEKLGERGHEPLFQKWSGTVRFDLTDGKRTERWLVVIEKGDVTVSRKNVRADCIVSGDKALFDEIASGKTNAMAAMLRGRIGVEGDIRLLVPIQRLFPGPRRSRRKKP